MVVQTHLLEDGYRTLYVLRKIDSLTPLVLSFCRRLVWLLLWHIIGYLMPKLVFTYTLNIWLINTFSDYIFFLKAWALVFISHFYPIEIIKFIINYFFTQSEVITIYTIWLSFFYLTLFIHLHTFEWFHVLLYIINNSIKDQSFVYTQLNNKTVLLQSTQLILIHFFAYSLNVKQFYLTH